MIHHDIKYDDDVLSSFLSFSIFWFIESLFLSFLDSWDSLVWDKIEANRRNFHSLILLFSLENQFNQNFVFFIFQRRMGPESNRIYWVVSNTIFSYKIFNFFELDENFCIGGIFQSAHFRIFAGPPSNLDQCPKITIQRHRSKMKILNTRKACPKLNRFTSRFSAIIYQSLSILERRVFISVWKKQE